MFRMRGLAELGAYFEDLGSRAQLSCLQDFKSFD
jgi:hypothetical protein